MKSEAQHISIAEFRARIGEYAHEVSVNKRSYIVTRYDRPLFRIDPIKEQDDEV